MGRLFRVVIATLLVIFLFVYFKSSWGENGAQWIEGNGNVIVEHRDVHAFSKVKLEGDFIVNIEMGDSTSVTVTGESNVVSRIVTKVKGDALFIGHQKWTLFNSNKPVMVSIVVNELDAMEHSGAGEVTVRDMKGLNKLIASGAGDITLTNITTNDLELTLEGVGNVRIDGEIFLKKIDQAGAGNLSMKSVTGEQLIINQKGTGNIHLTGEVKQMKIKLYGSGMIDARALISEVADVTLSGVGDVLVNVSDRLDAKIYGTGNIRYQGNPDTVSREVYGIGSIVAE